MYKIKIFILYYLFKFIQNLYFIICQNLYNNESCVFFFHSVLILLICCFVFIYLLVLYSKDDYCFIIEKYILYLVV